MAKSEASRRGKANKAKGNRLEREVVNDLKEIGYDVATSRAESKATDDQKIDIFDKDGRLPTYIQTKYTQSTPNWFQISEECPRKDRPFSIVWKKAVPGKKSPGTVAIVDWKFLLELLRIFNIFNNGKQQG